MTKIKNIALIGFMGCGKSTVGRAAAKSLGFHFVDSDAEIVQRAGMSVSRIFEKYGEDWFRALEKAVIADVSQSENAVIATGGGCAKNKENIDTLKKNCVLIYLKAHPKKIYENIKDDFSRPLLNQAPDKLAIITAMLAEREPDYIAGADCVVDVSDKTAAEAAEAVITAYKKQGGGYI